MPTGRIELVNRQTEVLFGYARDELLGRDIEVLVPARFRAAHVGHRQTFRAASRARPMARPGAVRVSQGWLRVSHRDRLSPVAVDGRSLVMAAIRDTSARQLARHQTAVAELSQRALLGGDTDCLLDAAVSLVARGLTVERAAILQAEPSSGALRRRASIGWADDAECHLLEAHAASALETSDPAITIDLATEMRVGGTARTDNLGLSSSVSVVIPGREQPFGVLVVHARGSRRFSEQDVHFARAVANLLATAIERHRAEIALRVREQEVRALVEHAPDLIARFDCSHRLLYVNPASERATGLAAQALIGRNVREAGLPEAQAAMWEWLWNRSSAPGASRHSNSRPPRRWASAPTRRASCRNSALPRLGRIRAGDQPRRNRSAAG